MTKQKSNSKIQTSHCRLYVDGMHCASCEVLIEKKLLKQDGIESVDASLNGNTVQINYTGNNRPNPKELNKEFERFGYKFSNKKFTRDTSPAISFNNGTIKLNKNKITKYTTAFFTVIGLLISFFIFEALQLGQFVGVDNTSALPAFFVLGLVAGFSSCAALIGGLLLSMIKQWNELYIDSDSNLEKAQPHIMFHSGRIISFTLLGGVLGLVGEAVSLNNVTFFALLTIAVSLVMLILALQMLGISWAQKFKFTAPKSLTRYVSNEANFQGKLMPFTLGMFTFILPCGFTLIAQTIALASGSFVSGAVIMMLFALGTFPALLMISYSGIALNSKPHLTAKFNLVAGLLIVFFVIYNINGQMNVLGYPSLSDISFDDSDKGQSIVDINDQGEQVLTMTAQGFEYIPKGSTTIKAGIPTKLVVENKGIQGCGAYMAARGLMSNYVALEPGTNTIELGKPQKGTYKITCTMGMVRPVTINVI